MLFWNKWPTPYKQLIWGILIVAVLCLLWFGYYYISGAESIIGWDILAKTERINVLIDTFKVGPFTLSTSAENPLFFQHYSGSMPAINLSSYYLLLIVTALCINILFAVVSTLPRYWYFLGTALFAFILVNYKFEILLLFGSGDKWGLIIALALFLPTSYYFNIKPEISYLKRLLSFLIISAVLAVLFAGFSEVDSPFLYLATYSIINPLIISLIFILIIAHEIIAAFIYLLTSSGTSSGKKNLLHFYIITAIYLGNLLLAYLYETHVIDWDIIYVNLFLLLIISAVLGLWGFAQREEQYKYLFNFYPFGALVYLSMATICFITLGHFTATLNDPAVEVFRDFIIYGHLGYGVIFVIYFSSNFIDPIRRNLKVYKVLYKPTNMPYFTFRLAGLIAFIALVMKSNWEVPVNQSTSAYFNGIGDLHYHNNELQLAETYYEEGALFGFRNHKSHYMLGKLAMLKNDDVAAAVHYRNASLKNPTPQSFINLSNIYIDQSRFFDAVFTLNNGLEASPENPEVFNNLGVAYAKTRILDTAAYYLHKAAEAEEKATAAGNIVALLAKHDLQLEADSVLSNYLIEEDNILLNNSFVLKNRAQEHLNKQVTPGDTVLTFLEASLLYNKSFNHLFSIDTLDVSGLEKYADVQNNINFRENLLFAAYLNLYKNKNITQAFKRLNWLANSSTFYSGEFFNIIGLWAMEQDAPTVAADYFTWAADKSLKEAKLNRAIALSENGNIGEAKKAWDELLQKGDQEVKEMAQRLLTILNATRGEYATFSDQQKYLYTRYRLGWQDTAKFNGLVSMIENHDYRGWALLKMSEKLWEKDLATAAKEYYIKLSGLKLTDQRLYDQIQWLELKMIAAEGNVRALSTKINQGIVFDAAHLLEKHYFTALINEASGDTTNARRHYEFIAYRNPFLEEATIAAANFIGISEKFEAYNILLNAIEINPSSVKLLKAYILQAARVQLDNYAQNSLQDLQPIISADAFRVFLNKYHQVKKAVEEAEESF